MNVYLKCLYHKVIEGPYGMGLVAMGLNSNVVALRYAISLLCVASVFPVAWRVKAAFRKHGFRGQQQWTKFVYSDNSAT